jgi:hypothetical protein
MKYTLENVTENIKAWFNKDPVRPELNVAFRTKEGREVFGLKDESGDFKAFLCLSYTVGVPTTVEELDYLTTIDGRIAVPYTVWSYQKGAGKEIINQVASLMKTRKAVTRIVTLSPLTEMAREFHLRNNAIELQANEITANFEYLFKSI